ncbi:MAG: D-ala D-ala ligase domain-containing protein [Microgenomates group bacterium GW2011_GWA2_44_7]|nr:MAG: D-ala D-ala ligase domain-containing protein [Microgenomates group bacterium GW2011_GWA2_44_7]KKT78243.1 MAG: D-ala D-ala ligase domain-containing protein [Microgenomates group bacterium GW2011_GWB1_44_8]
MSNRVRFKEKPQKVTIIYNSVDESSPFSPLDRRVADADTINMAIDIAGNLEKVFETDLIDIPLDHPESVSSIKTDIVFNLCEGVGYEFACKVIDSLESAHIPYIGANSLNYHIGSDKALLKEVLNRFGLPTPAGQYFENPADKVKPSLKFPLLIKPEFEHGSVGITQESVVKDVSQLKEQILRIKNEYKQGVLVEEYIDGMELQLTLVGNGESLLVLPIKEILFVNGMSNRWHVVTFSAKWEEDSDEYKGTPTICPTENLDDDEKTVLEKLGREIFIKTDCQDYTRIDIRYDKKSKTPYILDVNPNPDLSSDAAVAKAAQAIGWDYQTLLTQLVIAAWERVTRAPRPVDKRETLLCHRPYDNQ